MVSSTGEAADELGDEPVSNEMVSDRRLGANDDVCCGDTRCDERGEDRLLVVLMGPGRLDVAMAEAALDRWVRIKTDPGVRAAACCTVADEVVCGVFELDDAEPSDPCGLVVRGRKSRSLPFFGVFPPLSPWIVGDSGKFNASLSVSSSEWEPEDEVSECMGTVMA